MSNKTKEQTKKSTKDDVQQHVDVSHQLNEEELVSTSIQMGQMNAMMQAINDYQVQAMQSRLATAKVKDQTLGTGTYFQDLEKLNQKQYAIRQTFGRRRRSY